MGFHLAAQLFRHAYSAVPGGFRHHDREFVSAVAAYHVHLAQLLLQDGGNRAQHLVAQQMPEFVVHLLEVVDVHHDH
jgi:hypothetical protein